MNTINEHVNAMYLKIIKCIALKTETGIDIALKTGIGVDIALKTETGVDIALKTETGVGGILTIIITNLPLHISRYFTKIRLNYNPINKKIHLRTNSADEDIAHMFGIISNDKHFHNSTEVIAFLSDIIHKRVWFDEKHKGGWIDNDYKRKYYKYKQKYIQLLKQLEQKRKIINNINNIFIV